MVVTWSENNTIHTFGKDKAPDNTSFSTTTSGMGPLFGSSSTSSSAFGSSGPFGSSAAPTPTGGSSPFSFGQTPAPTNTFGSSAPAATTFGTSPFGAAPSTTAFGSSSTGFFASSPFGAPTPSSAQQQQQPQGPLIPAEVALQASLHANARNEESRVQQLFQNLQEAYTDGPARDNKSHPLSMVVYDPASDQQRQLKAIGNSLYYQANGTGGTIVVLPNPPQLTRDDWNLACLNNPAPETHTPQVMVGAGHLHARGLSHQEEARKLFGVQIVTVRKTRDSLVQRQLALYHQLDLMKRRNADLQLILLRVLKYVHIFRCYQQPLQPDEMKAQERLIALQVELARLQLPTMGITLGDEASEAIEAARSKQEKKWMQEVLETRAELAKVTEMLQDDNRDLTLIHERVIDDVATVQRR